MTLEIVNRRAWGASHADGFGNRSLPYVGFVLHHTGGSYLAPSVGLAREARHVRALESVGQSRFGGGISYPWVVMASGRVFQGLSPHRRGAHTRGLNTSHSAISLPGNFDINQLTPQQEEAIAQLMVREKRLGHAKHARILLGHRQAPDARTACPGRNGMAAISRINARAAALEGGARTTPEDDVSVSDFAKAAWDWGRKAGIFSQHTKPKDPVTAETLAVFLHRAAQSGAFGGFDDDRRRVLDVFARELLAEGSNGTAARYLVRHLRNHPSSGGGLSQADADKRYAPRVHRHNGAVEVE